MVDTKVHYHQYWGATLCGLRKSATPHLVTHEWKEVTCVKCLSKKPIVGGIDIGKLRSNPLAQKRKYYHATPSLNVPSILKLGLSPSSGTKLSGRGMRAIYLARGYNSAIEYIRDLFEQYEGKLRLPVDWTILEVTLPPFAIVRLDLEGVESPEEAISFYTRSIIPAQNIRVVGKYRHQMRNPISLYQAFHGALPKRIRKVKFELPKGRLVKIGRLISLDYAPENPSRHVGVRYTHKFGDTGRVILPDKPLLVTDSKGKNLYIIKDGAKTHFTERGIIA